jgi:uncharacterized protein
MIQLSKGEARYLALHNQLLLNNHPAKTKRDLLKIIEKLGYIQIDTISIVERAHKHVLWTRFPTYDNSMLDELIDRDKKVFEFWDHAASYLPMKHYRFSLPRKKKYIERYKEWARSKRKLLKYVKERIKAEGPLQSKDFSEPGKRGDWWDWKPTKDALEYLFHSGELMVHARKSFQKVYDLPERILPKNVNDSLPDSRELSEHLIMKAINANGVVSMKEMTYLRRHDRTVTLSVINELTEDKKIKPIRIEGIEESYYSTPKVLRLLNDVIAYKQVRILSPFDNLVIQRKRLNDLFDFDYTIECYVPAQKRKYGYFALPVIYGDKFIGRLDAKADRKARVLKVINFFPEKGVTVNGRIKTLYERKLLELTRFSGCESVNQ